MGRPTIVLLVTGTISLLSLITQAAAVGYCPSYCDTSGYYHEVHHCHQPEVYCCGSSFQRYCCSNYSQDISTYYPDNYNCNTTTWMQIHWQVIITMTGSILLILLFSACCCQCCRLCSERAMQAEHRVRFSSTNVPVIVTDHEGNQFVADSTDGVPENGQVTIQMFNPESPYAFTPPDYESLPKDPPKYNDVITCADGGTMNPCYIPDTPPPPFSEVEGARSHPLHLPASDSMAEEQEATSDIVLEDNPSVEAEIHTDINLQNREMELSVHAAVVVGSGFIDVDLTVDPTDDADRPLTSHNAPQEPAQEEAREYCLATKNDTMESER